MTSESNASGFYAMIARMAHNRSPTVSMSHAPRCFRMAWR